MMRNDNEPIVDAMLDEWLGGRKPRSLTTEQLATRHADSPRFTELEQALQAASSDLKNRSLNSSNSVYRRSRSARPLYRLVAVLAACLLVVVGGWWFIRSASNTAEMIAGDSKGIAKNNLERLPELHQGLSTNSIASDASTPPESNSNGFRRPKANRESLPLESLPFSVHDAVAKETVKTARQGEPVVKLEEQEIVQAIDRRMLQMWNSHDANPAAPVAGIAWIERIYQQLLGRPASQDEKDSFAKKDSHALRWKSIQSIVESPEFSQVWAKRLAVHYLDIDSVADGGPTPERRAFVQWIRQELNRTHRIDSVVKNIVLASGLEGSASSSSPSAHWWREVGLREKLAPAEVISSKFLGARASCSRCHDTNTVADSDQTRFWGMAAITQAIEVSYPALAAKPSIGFRKDASPLFYERSDATMVAVLPSLPNGQKLKAYEGNPSSLRMIAKQNLSALNDWMLQSDELSRSHVNFAWKMLFGQSLIANYPLDSSEGESERLAIANELAQQLRAHDYDLRKVVAWVAASQAFGLESAQWDETWYLRANERELSSHRHRQLLFASFPAKQEPAFRSLEKLASWYDSSKLLGNQPANTLANPIPLSPLSGNSTKGGTNLPRTAEKASHFSPAQVQYLINAQSLPKVVQNEIDRMINARLEWNILVDHAFYLTGSVAPTGADRAAAQQILEMSRDKRLALSRIIAARL